jgi:hypothetical protein
MRAASMGFGGVESRVRREKAVEGRAGRVGIALSKLGHGESEHRVGFCLMPPCERALIEVNGLVMTPETDAFVRQCPKIGDARQGLNRARELAVLTRRIEAN